MAEEVCRQLVLPEALAAGPACRYGVIPAEHEEQGPLLVVQLEGALAVEMNDLVGVERNGIAGSDRLKASRALRLSHCSHMVDLHDSPDAGLVNDPFDQFAWDQCRSHGLIRRGDVLFRHRPRLDLWPIALAVR